MSECIIRSVSAADAAAICEIYNHYVQHSIITFEELAVSVNEMQERIERITAEWPWLAAEEDGCLVGYAYAGKWKSREAYRFAVESTVYLKPEFCGRGMGKSLYAELIKALRRRSVHTVIAGIALPNEASVALHEKMGFVKVAHFIQVGWKFGHWIDVEYWELVLNPDIPVSSGYTN